MLNSQQQTVPGVLHAPATAVRVPVYVAKKAVGNEYVFPVTREMMESVSGKSGKTLPLAVFRHDSLRRHLLGVPNMKAGTIDGFTKIMAHRANWERAANYIQGETETFDLVPVFDASRTLLTVSLSRQLEVIDGEYTYRLVINDIKPTEGVGEDQLSLLASLASVTLVNMFIKESEILSDELGKLRKILVTEIKHSPTMKGYWEWEALKHMEKCHMGHFAVLCKEAEPEVKPYEKWALA